MASRQRVTTMPRDTDEDDDDYPKTYRDHTIARDRTGRLSKDLDAPRSPTEDPDADGPGSGFDDILEESGDVTKSTLEDTLEDALEAADFLGTETVGNGDRVDLSWSREDFEDDPTEADLLAEIRDELAQINADDRERALKSLTDTGAGQRWVGLLDGEDVTDPFDRLLAQLEELEGRLAARDRQDTRRDYEGELERRETA